MSGLLHSHLSCHCGGSVCISIPEVSSNVLGEMVKLLYIEAGALDASILRDNTDIAEAARLLGFFGDVEYNLKEIKENEENQLDYTYEDMTYEDMNEEDDDANQLKTENVREKEDGEYFEKIKFTKQEIQETKPTKRRSRGKGLRIEVLHDGKPLDKTSSTCPECHKEYPSHYRMRKHYRNQHTERGQATLVKTRICPHCGEECKGSSGFKYHMLSRHVTEKRFACDECDYTCKGSSSLSQHKKQRHREKAYFCDQCDKSYALKTTLDLHIKSTHEGERVFCQECGFAAKSTSHLNGHVRQVHQGQKFSCDQCPQEYNQRSNLILHMRKAHNTEIAKFKRIKLPN